MVVSKTTTAAELYLALEWDLIRLDEVIGWADRTILDEQPPPSELIDLSLASGKSDALPALAALARDGNQKVAVRLVLRRISEIKDISPERASKLAQHIYMLAMNEDVSLAFDRLGHHWDDIDMAREGVAGDLQETIAAFMQDVARVAEDDLGS